MPSVINNRIDATGPVNGTKMQLESLELAGCTLDRYISADNSRPSFLEITGIASQRSPTCSGLNAGDYRNLAALVNHPSLSQLKILNKVPLPPEIMEHFAHMQCHCLMGIFPEISRVWLAIDSNIYVWAFEHGSDVAYFDGLGETIVSVGLVKPKSGVFQNFVKYLLVLTTTVEIVVLGVTFSSSKNDGSGEFQEIHLVPEPVFVLPTDGISMMCVKSTAKGRIFMGGKDGCLYEITYQAQLGWFGKHCKKVNHSTSTLSFLVPSFLSAALYDEDPIVKIEVDNSRHVLYTLSEKGCIEVFDLGSDGEGLSRVVRLTQGKIVSSAVDIVKTLEPGNFKPVVSISAVDESESDYLNLVAVTQTGARLYFTTGSGDASQGGPQRPQYLTLLHVRLPPGFTPNSSVLKPKQVHSAVYENELQNMVKAGVVGFKCFLINSGVSEFPYVTPDDLEVAFAQLNGTGTVLAFHAEVQVGAENEECDDPSCPDPVLYETYLASRPEIMELEAASLITSQLYKTDVHVHVVHVSAEGVVPILEAARNERIKGGYKGWRGGVTAETCNHYLTLSSEQIPPGRTEYKCAPPIRNNTNKQKLWEYIRDERLDLITSDHSPSIADLKGTNFLKSWGGVSSVQFDLSLFWTEAKARGYKLSALSHYLSAGPARLCGLQEKKGSLRAGLDADLIFFDPNASFIVTPDIIRYKNKISPYMNRVLTGKVMQTYVRGRLVYSDGELIGGPKGELLLTENYYQL